MVSAAQGRSSLWKEQDSRSQNQDTELDWEHPSPRKPATTKYLFSTIVLVLDWWAPGNFRLKPAETSKQKPLLRLPGNVNEDL